MKATATIILASTIGLFGCNNRPKTHFFESKIPPKEFLIHKWMLDSVYGSKSFIQDWIFFTPDNKFWRCSKYSESQIIDSALVYKGNKIFDSKDNLKYSIFSIDSNSIILVSTDNQVFHCKRWDEYAPEDIRRFVKTNPTKKLVNGNWLLESSEISPTRIPSLCNDLYPGTKFAFNPNGTLDITPQNSRSKCNKYTYHIGEEEISITEHDMIMSLGIVKLTKDKLILRSKYVPIDADWTETMKNARNKGYNLYLTRQ